MEEYEMTNSVHVVEVYDECDFNTIARRVAFKVRKKAERFGAEECDRRNALEEQGVRHAGGWNYRILDIDLY